MRSSLTVVFDACVLYPDLLRNLLMYLALTDLFRAKWTEEIHEEWIRNVLKNRPDLSAEKLQRTRTLMNASVEDCLVTGYEELTEALVLPDPGDRHVLAAAIHSGASVIVTKNLKHFPKSALRNYNVEAQHPDDFISNLIDQSQIEVCLAAKKCRQSLKNPPLTAEAFLESLYRNELVQTVASLTALVELL